MKKLLLVSAFLLPAVAVAHVGDHNLINHDLINHSSLISWRTGLLHPLTGLDHLLTLVAIGLWLAQTNTRPKVGFIFGFALILAVAMTVGLQFTSVKLEGGIIATLVVLGAMMACAIRGSVALRALIVAATAVIHGFVHGTELPSGPAVLSFAAALTISSTAIIGSTMALGMWSQRHLKSAPARIVGGLAILLGVSMVF